MPEWFTRFLSRFLSLGVVVVLVGLMPDIAGIDPSQSILRARAGAQQLLTAEALQAIREDLQLDRSAAERLWDWLALAMQGDLGVSWVSGASVMESVQQTGKNVATIDAYSAGHGICNVHGERALHRASLATESFRQAS